MNEITVTLSPEEARAVVRNGNLMANLSGVFPIGPRQGTVTNLESALMKIELSMIAEGAMEK